MPCFFFISGWLLSDRHIDDLKTGLRRKVRSSYWNFVKWQLIFLAAHNLFSALHVYGDEGYSLTTFGVRVLRTLTMTGGEQLLGGYWFLISLFWSSVVSLLFFKWSREREVNVYLQSGG